MQAQLFMKMYTKHLRQLLRLSSIVAQYILSALITLTGLITITFVIGRIMPIDPVLAAVGDRVSSDTYEAVKISLGLDLPLYQQYLNYLWSVTQFNFGDSFLTNHPVLEDIKRVFPATIELATTAMLLSMLIGVPLGILAAIYQNRWPDHLVRFIGLLGNSFSIFWVSLMGLLIFYLWLGWSAGPGRIDIFFTDYADGSGFLLIDTLWHSDWDAFFNVLNHLLLPACILAFYKLALISRMTRTFMLEQLQQEYITTARAKGMPEWRVIMIHALGNAAMPLMTVLGLSYAMVLEGSTYVEIIFLWPGLGYYLTQALRNADMNAVLGSSFIIGSIFITINLLTDLLYRYFDPRLRTEHEHHRSH